MSEVQGMTHSEPCSCLNTDSDMTNSPKEMVGRTHSARSVLAPQPNRIIWVSYEMFILKLLNRSIEAADRDKLPLL